MIRPTHTFKDAALFKTENAEFIVNFIETPLAMLSWWYNYIYTALY